MSDQIHPHELALINNDLSKLNSNEKLSLYTKTCESLNLNKLTQPFGYIQLNGKLCLYAKKDATEQLRKIHNISIIITSRISTDGIYSVTARAKNKEGREDESLGAVNITGLKGDQLANAFMKAETKAKRRVTLSICGLGLLDETEIETIADAKVIPENVVKEPVYTKISEKHEDYKTITHATISTLPNIAPKVVYASKQEIDLIFNKIKELNIDPNEAKSAIHDLWKLSSSAYLRPQHAKVLLELLNVTKDKDDFKFQVEAYYNFLNPK